MKEINFRVYLITDRKRIKRPLMESVEEALCAGIKAVQLREKDLPVRQLLQLAYELRAITSKYNALLFINDRVDVALAVKADGVHLGKDSIPIEAVRRLLGKHAIIGYSSHSLQEAAHAAERGADFVTFSPVFKTNSKVAVQPKGLEALRRVVEAVDRPIFALGGITLDNVKEVMDTGVYGVAVVTGILNANNIKEETKKFVRYCYDKGRNGKKRHNYL